MILLKDLDWSMSVVGTVKTVFGRESAFYPFDSDVVSTLLLLSK